MEIKNNQAVFPIELFRHLIPFCCITVIVCLSETCKQIREICITVVGIYEVPLLFEYKALEAVVRMKYMSSKPSVE